MVNPQLPKTIEKLGEISENLWWSWNTEFLKIFKEIDIDLWERCGKNPVKFLKQVEQEKLEKATENQEILKDYKIQDIDPTQYTEAEVERYNTLSKALKKGTVKDLIGMGLGKYLFQTLVMGGITFSEAEQIVYSEDE